MKALHLTRPHAIMMVGIPGSGKSFFAQQFADTFHTPYFDYNIIAPRCNDGEAASELTLLMLAEIAKTKQTFIFEGNGDSRANRTEFAKWARAQGYVPLFVWTQTDQATSLKRTLKAGVISREDFASRLQDFSPPHPDEKPVVISGKHTYASQARVVLAHLGTENRAQTNQPANNPRQPVINPGRRNISVQ